MIYRENDPFEPPKPKIYFDFFRPFRMILFYSTIWMSKFVWVSFLIEGPSTIFALSAFSGIGMLLCLLTSQVCFGGVDEWKWIVGSILAYDILLFALGFMLGFDEDKDDKNYDLILEKFK